MDEDFEYFLGEMGPVIDRRYVPSSTIQRYRGKLPDRLLQYWEEYGWCGYADGLFWTVNPQEYEPVLEAWIGNTPFMEEDAYHLIARSAFGKLYFWGEKSGNSLTILPWDALAFPWNDVSDDVAAGHGDDVISWFFSGISRNSTDVKDDGDRPLFSRALKKLGHLQSDEMYGFVPAVALSGCMDLENLQKVKAVEHLVILAQLAELRVLHSPF